MILVLSRSINFSSLKKIIEVVCAPHGLETIGKHRGPLKSHYPLNNPWQDLEDGIDYYVSI